VKYKKEIIQNCGTLFSTGTPLQYIRLVCTLKKKDNNTIAEAITDGNNNIIVVITLPVTVDQIR
jgi:hypothetical protein